MDPTPLAPATEPDIFHAAVKSPSPEDVRLLSEVAMVGDELRPGYELAGRYLVESEVGVGSMARVYRAIDRRSGTTVAIKVLRRELLASVSASRFVREIDYLQALEHPNILTVIDSGRSGELLYFVTPFVFGETLRLRIARDGVVTPEVLVSIMEQLGDALDYAHARNIVHRDVKPENILCEGSRVVLCDFGIARAVILSAAEERLSSSGIMLGTPKYTSPEQVVPDQAVDGRCDIYALGCVAYELLTGEPPFTGASAQAILTSHVVKAPRPLASVRPDLGPGVERTVLRALAKEPAARPQSGAEFVAGLRGR